MTLRIALPLLAFAAALAFRGADIPSPGGAAAQTAPPAAQEEDEFQGMPPGKGREETFYICSPCHSIRMVTQQGLSKSRWNEAIDWMIAEQEMPKIEAEDRRLIVDYLARFYGEDRKALGGRLRLP